VTAIEQPGVAADLEPDAARALEIAA